MTELSLSHSYAFRWQDARSSARQARASRWWLAVFGIEATLLILLLGAYIFIVNDRVRLETASRSFHLAIAKTQENVSDLSLELAKLRSPGELEQVAASQGLIAPKAPRYLSL